MVKLIAVLVFVLLFFGQETLAKTIQKHYYSLYFQNMPIKDLLQGIAEFGDMSLVLSDNINGTISLNLKNITLNEALDAVLQGNGLVKNQNGKITYVRTLAEVEQDKNQQLESEHFSSTWIKLKHNDVQEMVNLLKTDQSLLSKTGQLTVDPKNNRLWVQDKESNLAKLKTLVEQMDLPEKQILIEARIVNIDSHCLHELGFLLQTRHHQQKEELHLNLPDVATGSWSITLAKLGHQLIDLELAALENNGHGKIIASPKLVTQNRKTALIESGEEIPYQEQTANGGTSVNFKKAVLSLKVTPNLLPSRQILMQLEINQDKVSTITVNGTPAIQTRELKTQVVMYDGQTIILGGIFEKADNLFVRKVPFLGDIPIIGNLFQRRTNEASKKELLIFVTPKIMDETVEDEKQK